MIDIVKALRSRATWETAIGFTEPHQHINWMAAEEITRLREENARLRDLLAEGDAALSWVLLEGIDEAYPTTCPVEYARIVDAAKAIAAAIQEGEKDDI